MKRMLAAVLLSLAAACTPTSPSRPQEAPKVTIRTDLEPLGKNMVLPAQVHSARWTVTPVVPPTEGVPGPTDLQLHAFLDLDDASLAQLGAPGAPLTVTLREELAQELLPAAVLTEARRDQKGKGLRLTGPSFNAQAFSRGAYHGRYALRLGSGVLVSLQTR